MTEKYYHGTMYHKIKNVWQRHRDGPDRGEMIENDWMVPEFETLARSEWQWFEKVDGMNIRVIWNSPSNPYLLEETPALKLGVEFRGKSDRAQIPVGLQARLEDLFTEEKMEYALFDTSMILYGEGYGAKIQKGGGRYSPDGQDFVLFDVLAATATGPIWLEPENVVKIAGDLGIGAVPLVLRGTIHEAIAMVKQGFFSRWSDNVGPFMAEGLVGSPRGGLLTRRGERIITKIKARDFYDRV